MLGLGAYGSSGSEGEEEEEPEVSTASKEPTAKVGDVSAGVEVALPVVKLFSDHDEISSEPDVDCSPELLKMFENYFDLRNSKGYNFIDRLHSNKAFGNPALLHLKVQQLKLNENGTNFPPGHWNPPEVEKNGKEFLRCEWFIPFQVQQKLDKHKREKEEAAKVKADPNVAERLEKIKAKLNSSILEKEGKEVDKDSKPSSPDPDARKRRSRSRSRSPGESRNRRSRSPKRGSRNRRSRSPKRGSRRRSRSPERGSRRRSRSPERGSRRRSRSPERGSRRRSRSPERGSRRRSRSPERGSRRRSKSPERGSRRRSKSPERGSRRRNRESRWDR